VTTYYYTASSLDGFIATPDHSLDWLLSRSIDDAGPMHYSAFERTIGAIAMGASTYAWLLAHGGREKWPYERPVWVFTHRALEVPAGADVRAVEGDVVPVHREMTAAAEEWGSGSWAAASWRVGSPTPACWTRSGCSSPP